MQHLEDLFENRRAPKILCPLSLAYISCH